MESMEARLLGWHYIELPTVSYYTTIARQQAPCIWFFSIGFYLNCQAAMHKYSHNHSRLPSAMIPASMLTGGKLWVDDPSGSLYNEGVAGEPLEVKVHLESDIRHATLS